MIEDGMNEQELWEKKEHYVAVLRAYLNDNFSNEIISRAYQALKHSVRMNREGFRTLSKWEDERVYLDALKCYVMDLRHEVEGVENTLLGVGNA
jgi:hypothetical protein